MHVGMRGLAAIVIVIASRPMYHARVDLLPGFHWLSWGSFAPGLVETLAYGVFFGLVFAPLYNLSPVKVGGARVMMNQRPAAVARALSAVVAIGGTPPLTRAGE